jgi:hypothetical protein
MKKNQSVLWAKILDFELNDIDSSFSFTDRLCRENDWSMEFASRCILEYKKYIFLVCISNKSQTPSDQVDQVWHLHLLYTESYWIDFCKKTLKKDIHHGPTKGAEQRGTFKEQYTDTLNFYQLIFKEVPPKDIWLNLKERFSQIHFTRVNRHSNWIIPKIRFKK